jgi:hypothetical protein
MNGELTKRQVRHGGGGNFIGHFCSLKMDRMVSFESLLERDLIFLLDFDANVLGYEEQPFSLPVRSNGRRRSYTPDFLIYTKSGKLLVEVKPTQFVDKPGNRTKFRAAERLCESRAWKFQILTEKEIRRGCRLANVKLLTQYARFPVDLHLEAKILSTLGEATVPLSIEKLLEIGRGDKRGELLTAIYRLAFFQMVDLHLDEAPLSISSRVSLLSADNTLEICSLFPPSKD